MDWATIVALIVAQGVPLAERVWKLWSDNAVPTQAMWDELKVLGKENARTRMLVALANGGIDPASDQGKAFLALVG